MAEKANTKPSSPPSSPEMLQGMAAALSKSGDPQIGGTSRFVRQKSPPRSKDGSGNAKIKGGISVLEFTLFVTHEMSKQDVYTHPRAG